VPDVRPLVLLPPSKGKAPGGDGPAYARVAARRHPLRDARTAVLAAVTEDVARLDDGVVARVAGVGATKVAGARALLAGLPTAPTMSAHRRYTGIVHGNAGLADIDPTEAAVDVRIVSALLGLVSLGELVPEYRLELGASLPSIGGLGPFWRDRLADHLRSVAGARRVWDLLPGEHRRAVDPAVRADLDVVDVAFLRPDGRPANAARTKVAKGRFVAALLAEPDLDPRRVAGAVDLGEGWRVVGSGTAVTATHTS
jgi:cytoplasmic iron level regulating protein YaaA (DUF328/UPF0246 family)